MKLKFSRGYLDNNHHGTEREGEKWNKETIRGWTARIVRLEGSRTLENGTEVIESIVGRRLWIYAPSGACWNFDVYLLPEIREVMP